MKLYHGSNMTVDVIDLTKGSKGKDFGRGFYLSEDLQQAIQMADITTERRGFGEPSISAFEFDEDMASALNILRFDGYTEAWAKFVIQNRKNTMDVQCHDFDIVYGPIADDRVGLTIRLYEEELLDINDVIRRLEYVSPTFQYFFGTERAIKTLKRLL